jgi:hypothetical protein
MITNFIKKLFFVQWLDHKFVFPDAFRDGVVENDNPSGGGGTSSLIHNPSE